MTNNAKLVYSTQSGRMCPNCGRPATSCSCIERKANAHSKIKVDGIIRIKREKKGRKGKTVTTISGFQEGKYELKKIAKDLKNKCGSGGSIKDGIIIIQGDHRQTIQSELQKQGFIAKLAGG